jgi:5S rRNA maturation endonuclease (ribonuclease M5)
LGRGIPWQTLINFNVGECMNPDKKMFQRATVPVLDIEGKIAVGSTGRSIFEKCPKCKGFHNPDEYCSKVAKWINAGKFADTYLYNLWNAKDKIKETGVAVLCEGQADVWAAWSAGIKNVVGIFGTELSPGQMATLEELGTMGLVLCLDNDDAGKSGIARIVDKYSKLFYTNAPTFSAHDLGDMSSDKIKEIIIPEINRMEKKCSIS